MAFLAKLKCIRYEKPYMYCTEHDSQTQSFLEHFVTYPDA